MQNESTTSADAPLDPAFVEMLACPACDDRPPLRLSPANDRLVCAQCGRAYPVSPEGIPILIVEEAEMTTEAAQTRDKTPGDQG